LSVILGSVRRRIPPKYKCLTSHRLSGRRSEVTSCQNCLFRKPSADSGIVSFKTMYYYTIAYFVQHIYVAKPRRGKGNKNGGYFFQYPPEICLLQLDPIVVDTLHGVHLQLTPNLALRAELSFRRPTRRRGITCQPATPHRFREASFFTSSKYSEVLTQPLHLSNHFTV
jgi:hypothetical protein